MRSPHASRSQSTFAKPSSGAIHIGILVINLDRSPERLASVSSQLANLALPWERIPAVDGSMFTLGALPEGYSPDLNRKHFYRPLSLGEIACFLSHRLAWQRISEKAWDAALILEDDCLLSEKLPAALEWLSATPEYWEAVKLRSNKHRPLINPKSMAGMELGDFLKTPVETVGYVLKAGAAQKLLKNTGQFGSPVDVAMQYHWRTGVWFSGLEPYTVSLHASAATSDISRCGNKRNRKPFAPLKRLRLQFAYNTKVYVSAFRRHGLLPVIRALTPSCLRRPSRK
ncbi:MAG: glycosyltransferase family 25 protein [Puniceicoccales bacterium]|nr:glycosyltransferase family 25 protein [Puniceicoccales bacterium]